MEPNTIELLLQNCSSLPRILHILSYCRRFILKLKSRNECPSGLFSSNELHESLLILVNLIGKYKVFSDEIDTLKGGKLASKCLRKLNPFLDPHGILRVGGRLQNSNLSFEEIHPALLPRSHRLTSLIIQDTHRKYGHPGLKTLQYLIQQNFWILSPQRAIRHCLSSCYRCFRVNPRPLQPPMGNLPSLRIQEEKAFQNVGVDFGGPFLITMGRYRGTKSQKPYICLFICLATKALHLELVSQLSTAAFLAALRRFIAQRGRCTTIMSDCGTNFIGASRTLREYFQNAAEEEKLEWKFNPPSAPHFGGIWEAGIKAVKGHLLRIIGNQLLTYEEFTTVLTQIEALLNSRPLCPLSSDPNDLQALTPGHFLTLAPLTAISDPNYIDTNPNKLNRWQLLQQMHQHLWKRWNHEYLHTLQQLSKWLSSCASLRLGTLVLIKDDLASPLHWRLGRAIKIYPDNAGVSRVAMVRTMQGSFKRPLVKLCPLPDQV